MKLIACDCEPEVDPDEPGELATHYRRTCPSCGGRWWGLHCPHDGYQNPCGACGRRPETVTEQTVWFLVVDLIVKGAKGEDFAVIKVDITRKNEDGEQISTIVSLHHDRAEADADAASWTTAEQFPTQGAAS